MKVCEILTESLSKNEASKIISNFVKFAANELNLQNLPNINIQTDNKHSIEYKSFGGYGNKNINLTISKIGRAHV